MRVHVHDPRGDDHPVGVDLGVRALAVEAGKGGDATVPDAHVDAAPGKPGAVHDEAAADDEIEGAHESAAANEA